MAIRLVDETAGFLGPGSIERFRDDLRIGYGVGAGMFAAAAIAALAANGAVAMTDGHSRKPVTVIGTAVLAAGLVAQGLATGGGALLIGAALVGAGSTGMVHGGEITLVDVAGAREPGALPRLLARVNLLAVVGDLLGPLLLAGSRAAGVSWRALFLATAVVVAAYAIALARLPFPAPPPRDVSGTDEGADRPPSVLRQRRVWLYGLAAFVLMPMDESYLGTVLAFAETERGVSPAAAAVLGAGFVAGGAASFTVLVDWVSCTDPGRLLARCGTLMATVMVVATIAPAWVLLPVGVVHSALLGATWLAMQAAVLTANPGREGRTKLIVESMEMASLSLVVALGVLADRAGLTATMLAYAAVPLALVPLTAPLGRRPR